MSISLTIMGAPMNSARSICCRAVYTSMTSEVIWLDSFHSTDPHTNESSSRAPRPRANRTPTGNRCGTSARCGRPLTMRYARSSSAESAESACTGMSVMLSSASYRPARTATSHAPTNCPPTGRRAFRAATSRAARGPLRNARARRSRNRSAARVRCRSSRLSSRSFCASRRAVSLA